MTSEEVAVRRCDGKGQRLAWIDGLRGAAVVGMVVYHAAWDFHAYGLVAVDPSVAPGWLAFGRLVAGLFLALSGFGLALAHRQGTMGFAVAQRLLRIAAAAGLVSLATWIAVPAAPVWFGILHCIVVTNLIALALWRLPTLPTMVAAVAAWAAPLVLRGSTGPAWSWIGLSAVEPHTLDFRPVLPWLAVVLGGQLLGRTRLPAFQFDEERRACRALAALGRHSLLIYLLHQPLLLSALMVAYGPMPEPLSTAAILRQPEQAAAFLRQCRLHCQREGGDPALCTAICHCAFTAMSNGPSPTDTTDAALKRCAPAAQVDAP